MSTGHTPLDDRVYYKQVVSLLGEYGNITMLMRGRPGDFKEPNKDILYMPLGPGSSIMGRLRLIPKGLLRLWRMKPKIIHFHDFELVFALPIMRLLPDCKLIYDVHEVYPEMVMDSAKLPSVVKPFLAGGVWACEMLLSLLADQIVTTDDSIAHRFKRIHPHVETVFNYPRLDLFQPDPVQLTELKKKYADRTLIIYQGGMGATKGLFTMLASVGLLKKEFPRVLLLLVGPMVDGLKEQVLAKVNALGIGDNVDLVGVVPHRDVVNYMAASKIGLVANLPTQKWFKNIPIKQFEYMACALPVVGSDVPPTATYLKASGGGVVFDGKSPIALAGAVRMLLNNEEHRQMMGLLGRKAVETHWNWNKMERRLFKVYKRLESKLENKHRILNGRPVNSAPLFKR